MTSSSSPCDSLSTDVFSDWHSQAAGQQMIGRKWMEDSGRENCPVLELNQEFCFSTLQRSLLQAGQEIVVPFWKFLGSLPSIGLRGLESESILALGGRNSLCTV